MIHKINLTYEEPINTIDNTFHSIHHFSDVAFLLSSGEVP